MDGCWGGHWIGGRNDYKGFQSSYIAVLASTLITKVPCITTWEVRKQQWAFWKSFRGFGDSWVLGLKRLWVLETEEAAWEPSTRSKFVLYRHVIWKMVSFQLPPPWRMVGCFSVIVGGMGRMWCHLPKSYILKYHNYKFEQSTGTNFMYIKIIKLPKALNYQDRKY